MVHPGTQIFSIFGEMEAVAVDHLIEKYPNDRIRKIEVKDFGVTEEESPRMYVNKFGQRVRFAVILPENRVREFEEVASQLRM